MKCLTTGLFLLFLADSVVLGQPLHKNARLYVEAMSENLDSAIRAEIIRQRVPLRVVEVPGEAELIMKETSGFIGTQRHKEGIRLIIESSLPPARKDGPGHREPVSTGSRRPHPAGRAIWQRGSSRS